MPMEASGWLVGTGILTEVILIDKKLSWKSFINVTIATLLLYKNQI